MAIDLDTRMAIRHPDLVRIVRAVLGADEHDEANWIEWKSDLDLSTKRGCFPIARAILGMANRMPAAASVACEGLGYVVVGAEPGNLVGIKSVDPADLDQILEPWLGGVEGPRYNPTYVVVEERKVLVVVVEAPRAGDPIYTLRKEFDGGRDGDVFVRKPGRTERANSADVKALSERAALVSTSASEIAVSLVGDIPLSWCDLTAMESQVEAWVEDRRRVMTSAAQEKERRRHPESKLDLSSPTLADDALRQDSELRRITRQASDMAAALSGYASEPDRRTLDEYLTEVETWAERARRAGPKVVVDRYLRAGHGLVTVCVHNPTGRYLPKVMVEVHFEWEPVSSPELDYRVNRFPTEPRPYGKPTPSRFAAALANPARFDTSGLARLDHSTELARSWIEDGSVKIVFDVGDLRQEETDHGNEHYLFLPERPPGGTLHGTWKATGPEVHGVIRGTLEIPVGEDPVDLRALLEGEPFDDL